MHAKVESESGGDTDGHGPQKTGIFWRSNTTQTNWYYSRPQ